MAGTLARAAERLVSVDGTAAVRACAVELVVDVLGAAWAEVRGDDGAVLARHGTAATSEATSAELGDGTRLVAAPTDPVDRLDDLAALVRVALVAAARTDALRDARVEAAELRAAFHDAPAAIAVQRGDEHVYELANPRYRDLIGGGDPTGLRRRDVLPDVASISGILDRVYATGEPYLGRERPFRIDRDRAGWTESALFDVVCRPIRDADGRVGGVLTFAVEVTESVLARRRVEALAGRLSEQVERLRHAEDELRRAVAVRDDFLSIASHELRTPLSALGLQLTQLRRALGGAPDPVPMLLARCTASLDRLRGLIDRLFDVTHLSSEQMTLRVEDVDLVAVVRDVVDRLTVEAEQADTTITVVADQPVHGRWDPIRLGQVVTNLVANAVKYGAKHPVEVRVGIETGEAVLRVIDHGHGIAAADRARIFGRFERGAGTGAIGGLGLGLWITRELVERMAGTLVVESEPGRGSTFTVRLPTEG